MRIVSRKALREFWEKYPDAERALRAWHHDVKRADWDSPNDIRREYANASIVANNRVVFNIRGNSFRIIAAVNYRYKMVYVRFVGTHREYDAVDAATI
jgi:mRNA interferase HigB